jgi:hypothetical protein
LLLVAGVSFALLRLTFLALAALRLRRGMGPRRAVSDRRLRRVFARLRAGLARRVPARLTESETLASPIALGADEVCLPTRAQHLDDAALAAVLGHELAHLERRDNLWLMLGALVEAVFFFQPLNRLARRGLQESAELASDERAVELTDDPLGMARSLAEVAAWGFGPDAGLLASPVVSERGALLRRVRSLLDRDGRRQPRWAGPLLVGGLAALALALPSLGDGEAQAAPPDVAPVVVPALNPPRPPEPVKALAAPIRKPPRAPRPPRKVALVDPSRVVPPPAPAARSTPTPPTPPAPVTPAIPPVPPVPPLPPVPPVPAAPRFRLTEHDHGSAFVLVKDGNATALSASAAELREAVALKSELKGEYLWVRRHDKKVVLTDPEAIASLRPMLEEQRGLRDREAELGVAMAELGKRQAELGKQQAEMGARHAELGMKSAELGVRRADLEVKRMEMKLKARQVPRPHTEFPRDGKNDLQANEREIAELNRMESEIKGKREELGKLQRELGQKHGELGRQQGELGRQQGELGRQQGELGRRMGDVARDRARLGMRFGSELDRVVDQQVGAGKARVLEPGKGR